MKEIALVEGEEAAASGIYNLTLTSQRIRFDNGTRLVSITLDAISSCGVVSKAYPFLLLLAALAFAWAMSQVRWDWIRQGVVEPALSNAYPGLGAAVVLVILYLVTRSTVIEVSSNGGEAITIPIGGMKRQVLVGLVDAVEQQKLRFVGRS